MAVRLDLARPLVQHPAASGVAWTLALLVALPPLPARGGGGGGSTLRRWLVTDPLGSGVVWLDAAGVRLRHTEYAPFGQVDAEVANGGAGPPRIYAGHRAEPFTGFVYMQARWLDPGSGTFASIDPVVPDAGDPQSVNAYAYARNNPVSFDDPSGMCVIVSHCYGVQYGIEYSPGYSYQTTSTYNQDTGGWSHSTAITKGGSTYVTDDPGVAWGAHAGVAPLSNAGFKGADVSLELSGGVAGGGGSQPAKLVDSQGWTYVGDTDGIPNYSYTGNPEAGSGGGWADRSAALRSLESYFTFIAAGVLVDAGLGVLGGISPGVASLAATGILATPAGAAGVFLLVVGGVVVGGTMVALGAENLAHQATGETPISNATGIRVPIFGGGRR